MSDIVTQARPEFYTAGGTLKPTAPSYIERAADKELLEAIQQHQFCYILTPRQMGKSSLMVHTAKQLQQLGSHTVIIDLTSIGTTEISIEQWYLGQIHRIVTQLNIGDMHTGYLYWWQQQRHLSIVQRFTTFLSEVVLNRIAEPVVIFIDEIDTILSLPKIFNTDDYFAAIRAVYNDRATNPSLERLNFVLLGVVSPSDLIKDPLRTPFNIGTRIELTDFTTLEDVKSLMIGLAPDLAEQLLKQIFSLTSGHPYLTQKTCLRVAKWAKSKWDLKEAQYIVEDLAKDMYFSETGKNTDDNLQFIRKRILESKSATRILQFYRRIRGGETLLDSELDPILVELKLSGLVKSNNSGVLVVRNQIYKRVFDEIWISKALTERKPQHAKESQFPYDVFISYSSRDREWVRSYLLPHLEAAGLKVWVDFSRLRAGDNVTSEMEKALAKSRNMIVILSPDSVASEWVLLESRSFLSLDFESNERRLIPIMLKPTQVPPPINRYQWVNFSQEYDWEAAMNYLLNALEVTTPRYQGNIPARVNITKAKRYDTKVIRKLLSTAFDSQELREFEYDYFPSLSEEQTQGITAIEMIHRLVEYADQHQLFDELLDYIAKERPRVYSQFANQLEEIGEE